MASSATNPNIRYEPDDKCPATANFTTAIQGILFVLAPTILVVAITVRSAGQDESFLAWAAFATLIIVGGVVALQAAKIGRIGGGHFIVCGVTPNYIAIAIIALDEGGPSMLASLMVISAVFYYALGFWLPYLRRVITPAVAGTILMLIAALILPTAFKLVQDVPSDSPGYAGSLVAAVTAFLTVGLALRAPRKLRPWSLPLAILSGCAVAVFTGIYDFGPFTSATWVGIPDPQFPGLDLTPDLGFWALLPMFVIVTLLQSIKNLSDAMVIQHASRREPRTTDFRLIQGSIYANGTGILMSGLAGTPPTSTYPSMTAPLIHTTGVASRTVGYAMAAMIVVLAFFPKVSGFLLTIPNPVMGGFLIFAVGFLFVEGIQAVVRSGLDTQTAMITGIAFAIGLGMQQSNLFGIFLADPLGSLLGNGITVGAAIALGFTALLELSKPKPKRLETTLEIAAMPKIDALLQEVASSSRWDPTSSDRLRSAGEETLTILIDSRDGPDLDDRQRERLLISARSEENSVTLEFVTVFDEENIQDRLAYLGEMHETVDQREISYRILRHYASSVQHQRYHGVDIVTVVVEGSSA